MIRLNYKLLKTATMLNNYKTEIRTYNEDTELQETWSGPDIMAVDEIEALFLLDFLKMYHVHLVGYERNVIFTKN